jgi:glutamate racemase
MNKDSHNSDSYTIVVTDSGLGGISVLANLEHMLRHSKNSGKVRLIFFNALANKEFGYNSMPTNAQKSEVFNSALNAMMSMYNPDIILIACNTLSVVYDQTDFAKGSRTDVFGIIDLGIEMILEKTNANEDSILLFGTPTTIFSLTYHKRLVSSGITEEFIINQACPLLETEIQNDPESENVKRMIKQFSEEANRNEKRKSSRIVVGLCCTHYGYSENIFFQNLKSVFNKEVVIVNPNQRMVEAVFKKINNNSTSVSELSVEIISQVRLKQNEILSINKCIDKISPATVKALSDYTFNQNLFKY